MSWVLNWKIMPCSGYFAPSIFLSQTPQYQLRSHKRGAWDWCIADKSYRLPPTGAGAASLMAARQTRRRKLCHNNMLSLIDNEVLRAWKSKEADLGDQRRPCLYEKVTLLLKCIDIKIFPKITVKVKQIGKKNESLFLIFCCKCFMLFNCWEIK